MAYSWYEEDFADFLLKHNLPVYDRSFDIKRFYQSEMDRFISDYNAMLVLNKHRSHPEPFYEALDEARNDIMANIKDIENVLKYYDEANYELSQNIFDSLMERIKGDLLLRTINGVSRYNPQLYRIRTVTTNNELKKPADLFHIPFTKRQLITNERYSLAGTPCLYLATSLGIAWQECGYPSKFYFSEYQYQYKSDPAGAWDYDNEWKFITFLSPRQVAHDCLVAINKDDDERRQKFICSYIKTYPLLLACSIVNLSGHSVFKQEYIIPQMLLQWVRRNIATIRGITYFSCMDNDDLRSINGYNVVIPAIKCSNKGYCKELSKRFKVSKPSYCDNSLDKSEHEKIVSFKNELLENINAFPFETMDCILAMYEASNCFDNLVNRTDSTDMKLVVEIIRAIHKNCDYIREKYRKDDLMEKIHKSVVSAGKNDRIDLFSKYYDRFFNDVDAVISNYDLAIEKIIAPEITSFYTIR